MQGKSGRDPLREEGLGLGIRAAFHFFPGLSAVDDLVDVHSFWLRVPLCNTGCPAVGTLAVPAAELAGCQFLRNVLNNTLPKPRKHSAEEAVQRSVVLCRNLGWFSLRLRGSQSSPHDSINSAPRGYGPPGETIIAQLCG